MESDPGWPEWGVIFFQVFFLLSREKKTTLEIVLCVFLTCLSTWNTLHGDFNFLYPYLGILPFSWALNSFMTDWKSSFPITASCQEKDSLVIFCHFYGSYSQRWQLNNSGHSMISVCPWRYSGYNPEPNCSNILIDTSRSSVELKLFTPGV